LKKEAAARKIGMDLVTIKNPKIFQQRKNRSFSVQIDELIAHHSFENRDFIGK